MREINYKDTVVDVETEPLPVWLEDRLRRWFVNLILESPPPRFARLLKQLKDDPRP